jgi:hypothetical protein
MKTLLIAVAVVLLLSSTACAGWYVGPVPVRAYYPVAPVYTYAAPVVEPVPYVTYSPVPPAQVMVPAPVIVRRPVVVGPTGRIYIVGRPVRNTLRAVLP